MMKIVIADDEWIIRERLKESIEWHEFGIAICGMARNGLEALELVKTQKPNILLTDIRMPGLSGLELINLVKKEQPTIKTVILTGFSEFNYAQQAIKLAVDDYVLKPVKEDELMKTMKKLVQEIRNEQIEQQERWRLYVLHFIKGQHIYDPILLHESDPIWNEYHVVCFDETDKLQSFPNSWKITEGIIILPNLANKKQLVAILETNHIYGGCSINSDHPKQLPTLYKQATIAKEQQKISGKPGCIFYEQLESPFQIQELLEYIKLHYHEQISLQNLSAKFYISDSYLSRIFKQYTGHNFIDYVTTLRIEKAKEYLLHSSLKTNEIASSVGYTDPRYFSQIFKKHTGHTPSEFKELTKKFKHL